LGPFIALGLLGTVLAKITVEVEVAKFKVGFAVLKKVSFSEGGKGQGQTEGGRSQAQGNGGFAHYYSRCLLIF